MKQIAFILSIILFVNLNQSFCVEDRDENESILWGEKISSLGAFIAPSFYVTRFDGKNAFLSGARGGIIFNEKYIVGFYGYGVINSIKARGDHIIDDDLNLNVGYGGFYFERFYKPSEFYSPCLFLMIGGGGLQIENEETLKRHGKEDAFFSLEPGCGINFTMDKHIRLEIGISYRRAFDVDLYPYENKDISYFNHFLSMKLGFF